MQDNKVTNYPSLIDIFFAITILQAGEINGYGKEVRADGSVRHEGQWSRGVPIRT